MALMEDEQKSAVTATCNCTTKCELGTMDAITVMRQYLEQDETELLEMSDSLLTKLEQMSDEEFDEMEKFPDFNY